ncbi:hypothetical protein HX786_00860 [Pseudomonas sp. 21615526]|uniref:hypothetical protein n=1 Tax=unclassified Pseudomonas TaxID=196821 RepID=UPI00117A92F9|nr:MULTISPECIES: hypothetical protein [unclassified Pseudomonas]NVZ36604.1 hypothetical protein [Pseudomonas sp. 21615526]
MKWMFWAFALLACVVSGFLGLTAGINLNPLSTVKFVPNWGSLADWISGFGSVSAAIVALYLADLQRRNNTAKIEISQYYNTDNFTLDIVSTGEKPAIVRGVFIRSPHHKKQILFNRSPLTGYKEIVGRYEYGETKRLTVDSHLYFGLALELKREIGSDDFDGLQLVVGIGIAEVVVELDQSLASRLHERIQPPQL